MRLYRLLLRLYPASFRTEYGEEMCKIFGARQREENALTLWIGTLLDVLTNAIRVHADILWQDLRWTIRTLLQSPGFTLTAVSVAALGMGANTAAFTLLDHVLLRPLPFFRPEKLVMLYLTEPGGGYMHLELSPPNYLDLRAMTHSFEAVSAYSGLIRPISARYASGLSLRVSARTLVSRLASWSRRRFEVPFGSERRNISMAC